MDDGKMGIAVSVLGIDLQCPRLDTVSGSAVRAEDGRMTCNLIDNDKDTDKYV